jgi:hypothetical protein
LEGDFTERGEGAVELGDVFELGDGGHSGEGCRSAWLLLPDLRTFVECVAVDSV